MKKTIITISIIIMSVFFTACTTPKKAPPPPPDKTSIDISTLPQVDFDKIKEMMANYHFEQAVNTFNLQLSKCDEEEKIENIFTFLDETKKAIQNLPNPDRFDFSKTEEKYKNLKETTSKSPLSWYDLVMIPTTVTIDAFGGFGAATSAYLALRSAYEIKSSHDSTNEAGHRLTFKELEDFNLERYENYKRGILALSTTIDKLYSNSDRSNDGQIRALKVKIKTLKKELSLIRCNFVSYTIIAPKLEISYMYARLYDEQWRPKNETLINNAFFALSNSGPLIQASHKDVRIYWLQTVLPMLKEELSQKEFEDKSAMLSLVGDGKTGAQYWLKWE